MKEKPAERYLRMNRRERELQAQGYIQIAGVDEAGRGPLAGPVFAAAVILDPDVPLIGLNDSKKLTAAARDKLFLQITERARQYAVASASVAEIDRLNILEATRLAMRRAVRALEPEPDYLLVDFIRMQPGQIPCEFIKKGDQVSNSVAAASILAKVSRDRYMLELDERYPGYGFASHKGYGTKLHYAALDAAGPTPEHRTLFLRSWRAKRETAEG
jgi:ribonuclease HII